ncbi:MAG: efflux RND transporter permease subunit [Verrucomicrobiae bacterium]|nr:efflux RND transporter permease subunit [Verrucomicrobiae bacterium]
MTLSELCIRRPIFATMLNLVVILFGLIGLSRLPVRELPDIDPPIVSVTTIYPGANAQVIETEVTERLEQEINNIPGIKTLTSESRQEVSQITVEFELNRDVDIGAQDVRDRVSRVRGLLPKDVEEPIIAKQDADAEAIMWIALSSDRYSTLELTEIAERQFKDRLQTLSGVGGIQLGGEKRKAMRLWLDSEKMAARGITANDIRETLEQENVELPSGSIENLKRELTLFTQGRMTRPEEFNNLIIKFDREAPIRLRDIGHAELGPEDERTIARYNGRPAVGLGVVKQSEANTVEVSDQVKKELKVIEPTLPTGITINIAYDSSTFVRHSIHEVAQTLLISFLLVVAIIFLFLRNGWATLIPSLAIPVSIVGTFFVMYILGFSLNILTLLALVLAIGVVVDDAIVVLENIYRHIEEGMSPKEASIQGMKEISTAVITITISLVAVFFPVTFQRGIAGVLFGEFSVAIAASVVISAFVALTLTPVLCVQFLHRPKQHGQLFQKFENFFNFLSDRYVKWLDRTLHYKKSVIALFLILTGITFFLGKILPKELFPEEDKGYILALFFGPEGATSEYTDQSLREAEAMVKKLPETQGFFSAVALARGAPGQANSGIMFVGLKEDRKRSVQEIIRPGAPDSLFTKFITQIKGVQAIAIAPKALSGFGESYQLVLQGPDLKQIDRAALQVQGELMKAGFLGQPRISFNFEKPQLDIEINRDKAAALGVSARAISETLQILLGGLEVSEFTEKGKEYEVIAQLERFDRLTPQSLATLYVRTKTGDLAPLNNFITLKEKGSVNTITHFARMRSATISGQPQGVSLGEAVARTEKILSQKLPAGMSYRWQGEARELKDSVNEAGIVLLLAIIIIYMVLASQFESLLHPFTVMLAVPLALFGALGLLMILGLVNNFALIKFYAPPEALPWFIKTLSQILPEIPSMSWNIYSLIGGLLLMGLVTKNSILLVEFANQKMREGTTAHEAMLEAARLRLRPILMTALSTIIGILPIAIGWGAGSEGRRPLGVVVIGGMLTSTFLTLFVVPTFYVIASYFQKRVREKI